MVEYYLYKIRTEIIFAKHLINKNYSPETGGINILKPSPCTVTI